MNPMARDERVLDGRAKSTSPLQWQHIMKNAAPELSPSPSLPPPSPATVVAEQAAAAPTYDKKFFRPRGFRSIEVTKGASSVAAMREPAVAPSSRNHNFSRSNSTRSTASTTSSHRSARSSASATISRASAPATSSTPAVLNNGALSALKNPAHATAAGGQKKQVSFRLRGRRSTSSNRPKPKGTPAQRLSRAASTPALLSSRPGAPANTPVQRSDRTPPSLPSSSSTPSLLPGKRASTPTRRLDRSTSFPSKPSRRVDVPPPPYRPRERSLSSSTPARLASIPPPAQRPRQRVSSSATSPSSSATRHTAGHTAMVVEEISPRVDEDFPPVTAIDSRGKSRNQPREERPPSPDKSTSPGKDDISMVVTMGVADSILVQLAGREVAPSPFSYGFKGMFVAGSDPPAASAASPTPPRHENKYAELVDRHDSGVVGQLEETPSAGAAALRSVEWKESPKEENVVCPDCLRHVRKGSHGSSTSNSSDSSTGNAHGRSGYRRGGQYSSDEDAL